MYKVLILPILISLLVHSFKLLIDLAKKRFSWSKAVGYGGIPSSHAALVASVSTSIYLLQGFSIPFALSLILASIILKDAIGLRGYLTTHAKILNKLIKDLPDEEEFKYPVLEERIGHTWLQLLVGVILGIALTLLFF
ncbi:divergent PAP2 family protein [Patescibacteria group bacterium]|nr:divergent PAP2 family protein [Patescibacteria group bacterium]